MEGVRRATPDDLAVLTELYAGAHAELGAHRGRWADIDAWPEPVADAFAVAIGDDDVLVLLGTIDDVPVGYAVCVVKALLPQAEGESYGFLRDLYVDPGAREVGIGEALVSDVIDWLRGRGIRSCDIAVLPGHRAAKNFCEENGFVARSLLMHATW